ncbi:MAG TPA: WYL domain-containing protein, partial [Thermomicrobiales bacterium]|nr:WYL domain-containing protein [Thermomicrobiales bacterium]
RLGPEARRYRDALGPLTPRSAAAEAIDADGWQRQELVFDDLRSAVAALLALSPEVEVVAPDELRAELVAAARRVMDQQTRQGPRSEVAPSSATKRPHSG